MSLRLGFLFIKTTVFGTLLALCSGSIDSKPKGWLGRVVVYHRDKFLNDVYSAPFPKFNATLGKAPKGFVDSSVWDFDSVMRLLELIDHSESTKQLKVQLLERLVPQSQFRRYRMDPHMSLSKIPSIAGNYPGFFYDYFEPDFPVSTLSWSPYAPRDDDVITISNPIESRMPATQITIGLLKDIMYKRALRARMMPTVPKNDITFKPLSLKPAPPIEGGDGDGGGGGGGAAEGEGEGAGEGEGEGEGEAEGEGTPEGDAPPGD